MHASRLSTVLLAGLFACAPPPVPESEAEQSTEPSIRITWPPPETPVTGCEIVTVEVENLTMVEPPSSDIVAGEGHYHLYHPAGYEPCFKPYCFVDFSSVESTTDPFLVAVLADSAHNELLDANGDRYEHRVPIEFVPGDCTLEGTSGGAE
jgi:hypothetical protein